MKQKSAAVIGGCGFIGIHCVSRLLKQGYRVLCIDNLSRPTALANLKWVTESQALPSGQFTFSHADVRHAHDLENTLREFSKCHGAPELVIHQAAQVAVTLSVTDPRQDFEVNALGTFNVLEAVRSVCPEATVIFSSTNKVYGCLKNIGVRELDKRYEFRDLPGGVPADQPLDLYSPYGCSKGAGDQYMRDYARIYNLRTLVFRQSCIYGTRQFGQEDQGWVSWFVIASVLNRQTTVYGNGKQLRDLLWVDDLLDAYWTVWQSGVSGEIFNIGGGPENTLSLLEMLDILRELDSDQIPPSYSEWRPGDQPVYISDISDLRRRFDWRPMVSPPEGLKRLWVWAKDHKAEIEKVISLGRGVSKEPAVAVAA